MLLQKLKFVRGPPKLSLTDDGETVYPLLLDTRSVTGVRNQNEEDKVKSLVTERKNISEHLRLSPLLGSDFGSLFCCLNFLKPDFALAEITVQIDDGAVSGLSIRYTNGLVATLGSMDGDPKSQTVLTVHGDEYERIIACSIEIGHPEGEGGKAKDRVTAIHLYSNYKPPLLGHASDWRPAVEGKGKRGEVQFAGLAMTYFDSLLANGHLKGFWGRAVSRKVRDGESGIYRLGPVWGIFRYELLKRDPSAEYHVC